MPAVLPVAHLNELPQFDDLFFVVRIDVVDVVTTKVGLDFYGAVIAPVSINISNGVTERTRESSVITMSLKLRFVKAVDPWDVAENSG